MNSGRVGWSTFVLGTVGLSLTLLRCTPTAPPSLLLVTIDTLRADRVGAYGSRTDLTPAFDSLAASGWLFERAVASVPLTLPSHATLLSGLEPLHHGVRNNGTQVFPATRETLATHLKSRGYVTGAFVSAVVLDKRYGLARGFDIYDDRIDRVGEGRSVLESERACDVTVAEAARWISDQTRPFFAWVHMYEPHAPYAPAVEMAQKYAGRPYDAEVATADNCLARLLDSVRAARSESVLTAVTADHGESLGEHGESTHGLFVYQSTLAVPLVIAGPGVKKERRTSSPSRAVDLAPTLLGLMGIEGLAGVDGTDLSRSQNSQELYAETDYPVTFGWAGLRSWRLRDLKFIDAPQPELYDLAVDPEEKKNLAAERPGDVAKLKAALGHALSTEVRQAQSRPSAESEERLKSLGYVAAVATPKGAFSALDPKDAAPLMKDFERALEAETLGDVSLSTRILTDLTKRDTENVTFLRSLASVQRRAGLTQDSIRTLRRAETLSPQDAAIAHDLALVFAKQGLSPAALAAEMRAVTLDSGFVDALNHLAALRAGQGDFTQARDAVLRVLAVDENNASAWSTRGNIARAQGENQEADMSYRRALDLAPNHLEAHNGLGVMAVEGGRLEEAIQRFERVLELDSGYHEARLNLAVAEAQRGNTKRALALATEVRKSAPDPALRAKSLNLIRDLSSARH